MTWYGDTWTFANSGVGILILGSTIGWTFLEFIWKPFTVKRDERQRTARFRTEADFRLSCIEQQINRSPTVFNIAGGDNANSIDPLYKPWSLQSLIHAGWGKRLSAETSVLVRSLRLLNNGVEHDTRLIDEAPATLNALREKLGLELDGR